MFRKGHSTKCVYTSTIAKAIYEVADSIGATISVEKVKRCSDDGSFTADMISKVGSLINSNLNHDQGNLREMKRMMPLRESALTVPPSILKWLDNPKLDMQWSRAILMDMALAGVEVIKRY